MIDFLKFLTSFCLWSILAVIAVTVLVAMLYLIVGVIVEFTRRR